ncbi:MAG: hypothetical protein H7Z43_00830, partial [Clostridia bacterium]|nr:hypothetical protein [Deltaproteobacteria bacterium]
MSVIPGEGDELARALAPLRNPLAYAAKNDFENLARVKDLEPTLIAAAERAQTVICDPRVQAALRGIVQQLGVPTGDRKSVLRGVAETLERIVRFGVQQDTRPTERHGSTSSIDPLKRPSAETRKRSKLPGTRPKPTVAQEPSASPAVAVATRPRLTGPLTLTSPVHRIRGVGPEIAKRL